MKHFIILTSIVLCTVSCQNTPDPAPKEIALTFLTAYFQTDYDQIFPLCASDSQLKSDLEQSARAIETLSQGAQDKLRNELSVYRFQIEQVDITPKKDSAFVSYLIFSPEMPDGIESHLTMVKEDREWRVAKLLNNRPK